MCGLCGVLGRAHWTDGTGSAGSAGTAAQRQARLRRVRLLDRILSHYRIRVDDWQGAAMAVRGATGRTELAETLPELWRKAELVAGREIDPLDPHLLDHLERVARGDRP